MNTPEIEAFLTDLAVKRKVSASTQNHAFAALLFLYREVLHIELLQPIDAMRDIRHPAGEMAGAGLAADDNQVIEAILEKIETTAHPGAQPRPVSEGIPFLGFVVFPEHRRLKPRKAIHFQRRLLGLAQDYRRRKIPIDPVHSAVRGWINHVRYANTIGLRKRILRKVRL
jgi:hypothetical protein